MARFRNGKRWLAAVCVCLLLGSVLPIAAVSVYNHPYYDDFGLSANVNAALRQEGGLLSAVLANAKSVRATWQGTYTGTILSSLQPGVFSERLYFVGTLVLLVSFLLGFGFFFWTALRRVLKADRAEALIGTSLLLLVGVQFLPNHSEAFFWYTGGIGNTFIYALLFASFGMLLRLETGKGRGVGWWIALALAVVLLGGGSYPGGVFGLCCYGCVCIAALVKRSRFRWGYLAVTVLFAACFLYNVSAPGNTLRAAQIGAVSSPVKAVALALYYGLALIGNDLALLPVLAVALALLPVIVRGVRRTSFAFPKPALVLVGLYCLYCTQLAAPLYSGVFLGGGRIMDTYFECFVALLLPGEIYAVGALVRQLEKRPLPDSLRLLCRRAVPLACAALLLIGTIGWKRPNDALYGPQNTTGGSALYSLVNGEARAYDREMRAREALLADASQPDVELAPLSAVPDCFMEDPLALGAQYDAKPQMCRYYGKNSITVRGGEAQ